MAKPFDIAIRCDWLSNCVWLSNSNVTQSCFTAVLLKGTWLIMAWLIPLKNISCLYSGQKVCPLKSSMSTDVINMLRATHQFIGFIVILYSKWAYNALVTYVSFHHCWLQILSQWTPVIILGESKMASSSWANPSSSYYHFFWKYASHAKIVH